MSTPPLNILHQGSYDLDLSGHAVHVSRSGSLLVKTNRNSVHIHRMGNVDIDPNWYPGQPELGSRNYSPPSVLTKLQKWGDYASVGEPVGPTRFIPMKTPLSREILANWSLPETPKHRLTVPDMLECQRAAGRTVGCIIDLSNHDCLYTCDIPPGMAYEHINLVAKELPSREFCNKVAQTAQRYWAAHPDHHIAIHCAYGFNRTGFVVCSYIIEHCGWSVEDALASFADARPPGVKHQKFREELHNRYDNSHARPPALPLPLPPRPPPIACAAGSCCDSADGLAGMAWAPAASSGQDSPRSNADVDDNSSIGCSPDTGTGAGLLYNFAMRRSRSHPNTPSLAHSSNGRPAALTPEPRGSSNVAAAEGSSSSSCSTSGAGGGDEGNSSARPERRRRGHSRLASMNNNALDVEELHGDLLRHRSENESMGLTERQITAAIQGMSVESCGPQGSSDLEAGAAAVGSLRRTGSAKHDALSSYAHAGNNSVNAANFTAS